MDRYKLTFDKDYHVGLPELVFVGSRMGGSKELLREALDAGQVERYWVGNQPYCRHRQQEAGTEQGRKRAVKAEQEAECDIDTFKMFGEAMEGLGWELPKMDSKPAVKALTQGKVPDAAYEPLEEAIVVHIIDKQLWYKTRFAIV